MIACNCSCSCSCSYSCSRVKKRKSVNLNVIIGIGMGSCLSAPKSDEGDGKRRRSTHTPIPIPIPIPIHIPIPIPLSLPNSSSFDVTMEMSLHRIPRRIFLNGSTHFASLYCKQGRKGINQDAMLLWENFCSKEDTIFCGVFDGHGPHGHRVAKKVRDSFPLKLIAEWDLHLKNKKDKDGLIECKSVDDKPISTTTNHNKLDCTNNFVTLRDSFLKASKVMDKELKLHHDIDCYCSGTTAVTMVKMGQELVIGNVGDSRAVLGTRDHDGSLIAVQLTTDLKPNLPREEERIRLCKGRVFALQNEPQVARVWLPKHDSPGLAMARAFGDFCLKDFGVISIPEISYHHLTEKDEFVVLASDGVWDVLSNKEVVNIVASAPRSCAARILVETAVQAWKTKLPTSKVDDCSVVCLFFDTKEADLKSAYRINKLTSEEASIDHNSDTDSLSAATPTPRTQTQAQAEESSPLLPPANGAEERTNKGI